MIYITFVNCSIIDYIYSSGHFFRFRDLCQYVPLETTLAISERVIFCDIFFTGFFWWNLPHFWNHQDVSIHIVLFWKKIPSKNVEVKGF